MSFCREYRFDLILFNLDQSELVRDHQEKPLPGFHDAGRKTVDGITSRLSAAAAQRAHHSLRLQAGMLPVTCYIQVIHTC